MTFCLLLVVLEQGLAESCSMCRTWCLLKQQKQLVAGLDPCLHGMAMAQAVSCCGFLAKSMPVTLRTSLPKQAGTCGCRLEYDMTATCVVDPSDVQMCLLPVDVGQARAVNAGRQLLGSPRQFTSPHDHTIAICIIVDFPFGVCGGVACGECSSIIGRTAAQVVGDQGADVSGQVCKSAVSHNPYMCSAAAMSFLNSAVQQPAAQSSQSADTVGHAWHLIGLLLFGVGHSCVCSNDEATGVGRLGVMCQAAVAVVK